MPFSEVHCFSQFVKRIVREMNVWSKLKHENIVPLLGIWENFKPNSYTVPVSPWMTNGTLEKYSRNDLNMSQRLSIMRDIARALDYMHNHEQGDIAHADLKPDNILVKDGRAYLCDFGLSHLHGRIEGFTSKQHGNNRWKAPEMISASVEEKMKFKPTCANDIYSFGLIFLFVSLISFYGLSLTNLSRLSGRTFHGRRMMKR
ncbi:kinase-like domain-containing protein [Phellopilus nigrolimitatus]|nr:kinase-like domain-containing protein [Phellopilus nigrolimitatus]